MPINDIVAEVDSRHTASPVEQGNAPADNNAPEGEPAPTTMNTGDSMLPPYLHIQTFDRRGALMTVATVLGLVGFVRQVMG